MRECSKPNRQFVDVRLRLVCLTFAAALLSTVALCQQAVAAESSQAPKSQRSQFDLLEVREFISQTLSRTESEGSHHLWGMQTRTVRGRVVDHTGQPVVGAYVAFVEPAGFGRNCYDENFDKTDEAGRFLVEGDFLKSRLVVSRGRRQVWSTDVERTADSVDVVWPQPGSVRVTVDAKLLPQDTPLIQITAIRYRGGATHIQYPPDENHSIEVNDQMPGEFTVAVQRTIKTGNHSETRFVEVGTFQSEPGANLAVNRQASGQRRVSGKCPAEPGGPAILYVERVRTKYDDGYRLFELIACEDGTFETSPLPPGSYMLRFKRIPKPKPAAQPQVETSFFRPAYAEPEWRYRIVVPETDEPLAVDVSPPADKVVARIQNILDSQGPLNVSWSHTDVQVAQLVRDPDPEAVQRELLRLYRDPNTPQEWQYPIRRALGGMLESPEVLGALLEKLRVSDDLGERTTILGLFRDSKRATKEIIDAVAEYRHDENVYIRSSALNSLGRLVDADETFRPIIIPWLIEATTDPYDKLRSDMVATLGRIKAEEAVPALEVAMEDPIGKVRVMAAWALWRITGERDRPIKLMTVRLRASDHSGKVDAANFLGEFGELPEITIKQLRPFTLVEVKPPYRGEKLLKFQLKSAATRTLAKVASQVLETGGGASRKPETQKFD